MTEFKKKILFVLACLFLVFILFGFLIIYPLLRSIRENSKELLSIKNHLATVTKKNKAFLSWEEDYSNLQIAAEGLDDVFVSSEMPVDFLGFLEKTAGDSRVGIETSLLPAQPGDSYFSALNFRLVLKGSGSDCLKMLERIESAPYLIEIRSLDAREMSEKEQEIEGQDVVFVLLIRTFSSNED